ncbi:hypothetical protein ABRP83_13455 [Pectobacterium brasiliense]|uniref:hypothetical protein n=1 Tax=Pectobacterium brasiliense TaxID=180957 RepID=UPI0032EDE6DF
MRAETEARVKAFRRALALAAGERSCEPVPLLWRDYLAAFPRGCCELASQTLVKYLKECDDKLFPYVVAMQWNEGPVQHGHVIVALDGDYIDLTLDQFDGYDDWIVASPIESGGQISTFLQRIRNQGGSLTTRKLTLDGIPGDAWKLYAWLKEVADSLLGEGGQAVNAGSMPLLVSTEIRPQYRDRTDNDVPDKGTPVAEKRTQQAMTHEGTMTYCYAPSQVRLRETSTMWISESGHRFRKSTGAAVGSGVWSSRRLDLSSIRDIQPDE